MGGRLKQQIMGGHSRRKQAHEWGLGVIITATNYSALLREATA